MFRVNHITRHVQIEQINPTVVCGFDVGSDWGSDSNDPSGLYQRGLWSLAGSTVLRRSEKLELANAYLEGPLEFNALKVPTLLKKGP